jgi:O-antigen/teichoic acid export membrane protein
MADFQSNNKQIAQNTFYLYLRMIISMCVSLYTSRIILKVLGVFDYGLYDVLGGVIGAFSFFSASMQGATQRFMAYELGTRNEKGFNNVFNCSILLYSLIALLILIFANTIGLWFILNKVDIGSSSSDRVIIVYHISIATAILLLLRIPHLSGIISQEKMSFFAYTSILEAILKLVIVYLIEIMGGDKLILYSICLLCTTLIINLWYWLYCSKNKKLYKISLKTDKSLLNRILSFSAWRLMGAFSHMTERQGIIIVLNIFWGAAVNAANGIANQVNVAVSSLLSSFQQAFSPAIIKSYAAQEYTALNKLIFFSSKISFILISLFFIPLIINIDYILNLWLVTVPEYTNYFCVFLLVNTIFDSYSAPLYTTILSTGNIAIYQFYLSLIIILGFILSCLFLGLGLLPYYAFIPKIIVTIILLIYRLILVYKLINIRLDKYLIRMILIPLLVLIVSTYSLYILTFKISELNKLLVSIAYTITIYPIFLYFLILDKGERKYVIQLIKSRIQ